MAKKKEVVLNEMTTKQLVALGNKAMKARKSLLSAYFDQIDIESLAMYELLDDRINHIKRILISRNKIGEPHV